MEAEWFANASCDRQWNDARLVTFPFPDQRAFASCSSELSRLHHWRAWRQQWYDAPSLASEMFESQDHTGLETKILVLLSVSKLWSRSHDQNFGLGF